MKQEDTTTRLGGYADDLHAADVRNSALHRANNITIFWAAANRIKLNAPKSLVFGTVSLYIGGTELETTNDLKALGWHLQRSGDASEPWVMPHKRLDEAMERLQRVQKPPGDRDSKLQVVAASVLPVTFAIEMYPLNPRQTNQFRRAVWKSVRQGRNLASTTALEVLYTVCSQGHRLDPKQVADDRIVLLMAGANHIDEATAGDIQSSHAMLANTATDGAWGPLRRCREALESINWSWPSPTRMVTNTGVSFDLPLPKP